MIETKAEPSPAVTDNSPTAQPETTKQPEVAADTGAPTPPSTGGFSKSLEKVISKRNQPKAEPAKPASTDKEPASNTGDTPPKDEPKKEEPSKDIKLSKDSLLKDVGVSPEPTKEEEKLSEEDLKKELENPHKSEKAQRRYRQLWAEREAARTEVATTKKEIEARDAKLNELEAKLTEASKKVEITPEIQKQLDELVMYRRQYELDNDPEVKTKFEGRLEASEASIYGVFKRHGMGDADMDYIKKLGGWSGFAKEHPEQADTILDKLPFADRQDVLAAMTEQRMVKSEKEVFLKSEKARAKEYFEKKSKAEAEERAKQPDPIKIREQIVGDFKTWKDQVVNTVPVFKQKEIPADASPEVRKGIEEDNRLAKALSAALDERINANTPEQLKDMILESVLAYRINADREKLVAENASLKKELEKVRSAGRTTGRASVSPSAPAKTDDKPPAMMTLAERIEWNRRHGKDSE